MSSGGLAVSVGSGGGRGGARVDESVVYGAVFALTVAAFCLNAVVGPHQGPASEMLRLIGNTTCGASWLFGRSLFRDRREKQAWWPLILVLVMVMTNGYLQFVGGDATPATRMIGNVSNLVSSTLILFTAIEPLTGLRAGLSRAEVRFRILFAAGNAIIVAVGLLWVRGAPDDSLTAQWGLTIQSICANTAVAGMLVSLWHRRRHPADRPRARAARPDANGLGEPILRLMTEDALYTRPGLKVADVARRLGEADYKVTQAITGVLGFRNFNDMVNHFRIEEAKRRLADPAFSHLPVLTLAYDCGFGSIGPFNRAFKAATGVTPLGYRRRAPMWAA